MDELWQLNRIRRVHQVTTIERLGAIVLAQVKLVSAHKSQGLAVGVVEVDVVIPLLAHPANLQGVVIRIYFVISLAYYLILRIRSKGIFRRIAVAVLLGRVESLPEKCPSRH